MRHFHSSSTLPLTDCYIVTEQIALKLSSAAINMYNHTMLQCIVIAMVLCLFFFLDLANTD